MAFGFSSDDELIAEARQWREKLLNFFWRLGVSHYDGEDLVQETYLRLWRYRNEYRPTAKLSTFLFMIARQVRIDALRRQTRRENRERIWESETPSECGPAAFGLRDDMRWAISQLPESQREVIELGVFQDLPYAEIADILKVPVGTVKSRMFNALRKLKEVLNEQRS